AWFLKRVQLGLFRPRPDHCDAIWKLLGAAGFGTTESWKVLVAVLVPSLTEIVMFATPVWPKVGVTVTVRLFPVPAITMLPTGTTDRLSEAAERIRLATGVSGSLIVNGIAGVDVLTAITRLVIVEITGGWLI